MLIAAFISDTLAYVLVLLLFPGIPASIAGIMMWARRSKRNEAQRLLGWANRFGFQFADSGNPLEGTDGESLQLLRTVLSSPRSEFRYVMRGKYQGLAVILFNVTFVNGYSSYEQENLETLTVAAFRFAGPPVPEFQIRPQNLLHQLKNRVTNSDIAFTEAAGLGGRWFVRGVDEEAVREFLPRRFLAALAACDGERYTIEGGGEGAGTGSGGWVLVYSGNVAPQRRSAWLEQVARLIRPLHEDRNFPFHVDLEL